LNYSDSVKISLDHNAAIQPSIVEVQKSLIKNGDVLLDYMISELGSYLIVIGDAFDTTIKINIPYDSLQKMIGTYYCLISQPPTSGNFPDSARRIGRSLYDCLIPEAYIGSRFTKRLIIVSSGLLNLLPLEALIGKEGFFLAEKYAISYAPSVKVIELIKHRNTSAKAAGAIAVFGGPTFEVNSEVRRAGDVNSVDDFNVINLLRDSPLLYAAEEVKYIKEIFGEHKTSLFWGDLASEINLKSLNMNNVRIIHFATHGYADQYDPNRSAILLSTITDFNNDGLLQPEEIMQLPLNANLVFLSACKTGPGKSYPGEGIMSLARPFLIAGSQSVIVTYWNINDRSSASFIKGFYENLKDGQSLIMALAMAKRKMLSSERELYHHPYYWAGFVLAGIWE
jgi:CHAT domain-containing protein